MTVMIVMTVIKILDYMMAVMVMMTVGVDNDGCNDNDPL